jgi:hypothetical protein
VAVTSVFGTVPYEGLRWRETVTAELVPVMAPGSYVNALLPDTAAIDTAATPAAAAAFVAQRENTYINTTLYSEQVVVVDENTPLVPVSIPNPPRYQLQLAGVLADGVPIPDGLEPEADSDAELCIYHPGRDKLWELWRARKDPTTGAWTCRDGGRMSYVSRNPGHWLSRQNGAVYPDLPADPAKRDTFEVSIWGATAAKLPLLGLTITVEDVRAGVIAHALGVASDPHYIVGGKRWPAQAYDTNTAGGGLQSGMRFRLPAGYTLPDGLHPIAAMIGACARDYGWVLWDRAGALTFRAEPAAHELLDAPASRIFDGFPWGDLVVLRPGSDQTPNPTA